MEATKLEDVFTYHAPTGDQPQRYERIRQGAKLFADIINEVVVDCDDKIVAIRKLRECVMTANAAIALEKSS